jgi:hypothetical protein
MRRVVLGLGLFVSLGQFTPMPSAHAAAAGAGVVAGTGTVAPGLTAVAGPQAVTLTASLPGVFAGTGPDIGVSILACAFAGPSVESIATGVGVLTGGCTGFGLGIGHTCTWLFTRVGSWMVVQDPACASFVGTGVGVGPGVGLFQYLPTTANPTTTFALVGPYAFAG